MENPFVYTRSVDGKLFCNRKQEQAELLDFIENSQNVLLYSHRRFGKTSLINQVFQNIQKKRLKIGTIIVDLYGTLTEEDFISVIFQNLHQIESKTDKVINTATKLIKSIKLKHTFDPVTQSYTITPEFGGTDPKLLLDGVMKIFETYSQKKKLVIAFDEFQEVAKYSGAEAEFEKRLRTHIQRHKNICYIYSGSQTHILTRMFNDSSRAFYKQAQSYTLSDIEFKDYELWIKKIFSEYNRTIETPIIEDIVGRCDGHPMYIQQFLYFLFRESDKDFSSDLIDQVEQRIIEHNQSEYINLWDALTQNQKKVLRLIVMNDGKDLYNSQSLQKIRLANPSMVSRALSSLLEKGIISKNAKYHLQDIFFKRWLERYID